MHHTNLSHEDLFGGGGGIYGHSSVLLSLIVFIVTSHKQQPLIEAAGDKRRLHGTCTAVHHIQCTI